MRISDWSSDLCSSDLYHSVSDCATDDHGDGHSDLVGYAFDGFGIFGHYGEDGETLTNDDLDECHGHTHEIEGDGRTEIGRASGRERGCKYWEFPVVADALKKKKTKKQKKRTLE